MLRGLTLCVWMGLMALGCGPDPNGSDACVPGRSQACQCADGASGAQRCLDDGLGLGDCECVAADDVSGPDMVTDAGESDAGLDASGWDAVPAEIPEVDAEPVACDPPLEVAEELFGLASATVQVQPSGGTGAYRFELVSNETGGFLDPLAGLHVLGDAVGAVDVIAVTDLGCLGVATTTVHAIERFEVSPSQVQIPTQGSFSFVVLKGSGTFTFELLNNHSGGSLSEGGDYVAGPNAGVDTAAITDLDAATVETVGIVVTDEVAFAVRPVADVLLQGQAVRVVTEGGSGHAGIITGTEACALDGSWLTCHAPGDHVLQFEDSFTAVTSTQAVRVAQALSFVPQHGGDHLEDHFVRPVGDLDGDGLPDALFGAGPASVHANGGGAVYIYKGTADGLAPDPVQVIAHAQRDARFGSTYATGDFNGDDQVDLVVGARFQDGGGLTDAGAVYRYAGLAGGLFSPEPVQTWSGITGYSYFGSSTAVCDFNGDGHDDLVIGAYAAEDKTVSPVSNQQGVLSVYLGGVLGLSDVPELSIVGKTHTGGAWTPRSELRLGIAMAAGDVDGDGLCDLAVSADRPFATNCADGAVFVYRGRGPDASSLGGLELDPIHEVHGPGCQKGQFGLELAMGDVDGDTLADVVIGYRGFVPDGSPGSDANHGSVHILQGAAIAAYAGSLPQPSSELPHLFVADNKEQESYWVSTGDVNGDGIADVLSASLLDESGTNDAGTLRVFFGKEDGLPSAEPSLTFGGATNGDRFGIAAGVVGDLAGGDHAEIIVFASRDDAIAQDAGQLYQLDVQEAAPGEGPTLTPLSRPEEPAGQQFGVSVGLAPGPLGGLIAVVAAPQLNKPGANKSGGFFTVPIQDQVALVEQTLRIDTHPKSQNAKQFGYGVASVGDFDGDGLPDLAVISYSESQPANVPAQYECGPSCGPDAGKVSCGVYIGDVGSLHIYRGVSGGGYATQPAFLYYGLEKSDRTMSVAGVGNVNGDPQGLRDIALGSILWDGGGSNSGGVRIIYGRPHSVDPSKIQVICGFDQSFDGAAANDQAGRSIAGLGDINADGCDDFVFGSHRHDGAGSDRGAVDIVLGTGAAACPTPASRLRLLPVNTSTYAGWSVAGGGDADGDGVGDLLVGIPKNGVGIKSGRAVFVAGAYLQQLFASGVTEASLVDPASPWEVTISGETDAAECGTAVAFLPQFEADGRAAIAMGCPKGKHAGSAKSGGAVLYRFTPGEGFVSDPFLRIAGETQRAMSLSGSALAFMPVAGGQIGVIGAPFGNSNGLDAGAAYLFFVESPE